MNFRSLLPSLLGGRVEPEPSDPVSPPAEVSASPEDVASIEEDTFFLCRIIGNDLAPRHRIGQSRSNVEFILENEPDFTGCEKFWIVNRLQDASEQERIVELLRRHNQGFVIIPFELEEYGRIDYNREYLSFFNLESLPRPVVQENRLGVVAAALRRDKNRYAINNNGARNLALSIGRARARWILPWDGNSFLSQSAWSAIHEGIRQFSQRRYLIVPMARIVRNDRLLEEDFQPKASEEPQIIFRNDARFSFDERFAYGRQPKVELLWRLGVPGRWDKWGRDPTDIPRPAKVYREPVPAVGWVARLSSGMAELEVGKESSGLRNTARFDAIIDFIDTLDAKVIGCRMNPDALTFYDRGKLTALAGEPRSPLAESIAKRASEALERGSYSVLQKTTVAPSGDPRDYWHPAPFWWPNPDTEDGLPYIRRDGFRAPGTSLFEPGSEQYDRSALQRLFDDTTLLALAWRLFGEEKYAAHAARLIKTWFLDEPTRMSPHMNYAQVRRGHDRDRGAYSGLIEAKDFYYFLDAVRLVVESGALGPDEIDGFRNWLKQYFAWMKDSKQGLACSARLGNQGTMFDLQSASIAVFLGDAEYLRQVFLRAKVRMQGQLTSLGSQPHELGRVDSWHYCCFNLAGWTSLARIAESVGVDLWRFSCPDGRGLGLAIDWLLKNAPGDPEQHTERFDLRHLEPLAADFDNHYVSYFGPRERSLPKMEEACFGPEVGFAPYWQLRKS